eukprot:7635571-Prorocentrum_lima.AAC.1
MTSSLVGSEMCIRDRDSIMDEWTDEDSDRRGQMPETFDPQMANAAPAPKKSAADKRRLKKQNQAANRAAAKAQTGPGP